MLWHKFSLDPGFRARPLATAALCAAAFILNGCAQGGDIGLTTGSVDKTAKAPALSGDIKQTKAAYRASPKSAKTAIAYARALRLAGEKKRSLAVLDAAAKYHPKHRGLAKNRGYLSLEFGRLADAEAMLRKALDPTNPDWRLRSALGSALASQGKQQQAQLQFAKALALKPNHPTILNNLALSYALDGNTATAAKMLRLAARSAPLKRRVQQNLALLERLHKRPPAAAKLARSTNARSSRELARKAKQAKPVKNVSYLRRFNNPTGRSTIGKQILRSGSSAKTPRVASAALE